MDDRSSMRGSRGRIGPSGARIAISAAILVVLAGATSAWGQQTAAISSGVQANAAPGSSTQGGMIPSPKFDSASGILVDQRSAKILWERNSGQVRAPASLTKILTALVVIENADLNSTATITPEARSAPGGRIFAESGWTFTVRDLLYGLLLNSGNDAAIALAQKVSPDGTVGGFMEMVNRRAAALGATHTHFVNPHGYDQAGHSTTARDLALITLSALKNPTFAQIVATKQYGLTWGDGQPHSFTNHNKMLSRYPGTIGVKTGYTNEARHSLVSAVNRNGATLVAVTLGSPSQYVDSASLFDWGFANLNALQANAVETLGEQAAPTKSSTPQLVPEGFVDKVLGTLLGPRSSGAGLPALSALFLVIGLPVAGGAGFIAAGRPGRRRWRLRSRRRKSTTTVFEPAVFDSLSLEPLALELARSETVPYVSR